jgi:outer membrane protein assembly factor BamD
MFRRALITVMLGSMASLCSLAQNTGAQPQTSSGTPTQTSGSASPAAPSASSAGAASPSTEPEHQQPERSRPNPSTPAARKQRRARNTPNPIANVDSKQPDKVLFDRAEDAIKHGKYDVARLSLQTLINTYPDSEYIARAKLAIGDSWYDEGGAAAMAQAESEYKDFITFFPNMPEAAEAQMKIANIHYKEMEKADRDPTHARRAEDEYRQMILQFPDSPLVPEAKQRLLEVQEVLAQREYLIGHFYYMRESYPAAIARLKSVADTYPLYSGADEALFELGGAYEKEVELMRRSRLPETVKGKLIKQYTDGAVAAYDRILTRYPLEERAGDARKRLEAMKQSVPKATPQEVAQDKAEIASRGSLGHIGKVMENFHHGPDVSEAAKVGEPTLVDPQQASAPDMVRAANASLADVLAGAGVGNHVSVERVNDAAPPAANAPVPRSDAAPGTAAPAPDAAAPGGATNGAASGGTATAPAGSDMKNDLAPAAGSAPASPPPPTQVNDLANSNGSGSAPAAASSSSAQPAAPADSSTESSSKKKKKKHLLLF